MGKENDLMLDYLRDNQRFADLFNGGLFGGETMSWRTSPNSTPD